MVLAAMNDSRRAAVKRRKGPCFNRLFDVRAGHVWKKRVTGAEAKNYACPVFSL